jgi:thymidylate synthase (FAD)
VNVKLISHSQISDKFSEALAEMDVQDLIAYCARVSNPANQSNTQTSEKLVRYLIKNKHWSPLEMVSVCLEVNTTRDIARQLLRHRSFSFQEFSQRYADPVKELDFVTREARLQDTKNRQNSLSSSDEAIKLWWENKQQEVIAMVTETYKAALEKGIAKEQARAILPEGNTVSRLYVSGTLRSFIHYIEVRSGNGTQKEHMEIAREMAIVLAPIFPMIAEFVNIKNS